MNNTKLLFDHIYKTAGTSFWVFLQETFGKDMVSPQLKEMKFDSALSLYKDKLVICGHFGFIPGDCLPQGYVKATILRDPRERVLSEYFFIKEDVCLSDASAEGQKIKQLSPREFFLDPQFALRYNNRQACHYASFFHATPEMLPVEELLVLAKKGLDQFDLVGTTERLPEFVDCFRKLYELPDDVHLKHINVTSRRKRLDELDPDLRAHIEAMNEVDLELWRYADTLFDTRTKKFVIEERDRVVNQGLESRADGEVVLPFVAKPNVEDGSLELLNVSFTGQFKENMEFMAGELATLSISFRALKNIDDLTIGYSIRHNSGLNLFGVNSRLLGYQLHCRAGGDYKVDFIFALNLGKDFYFIDIAAHSSLSYTGDCYLLREKIVTFEVTGFLGVPFEGLVRLMPSWWMAIMGSDGAIEAESIIGEESTFQLFGFRTPEVHDASGFLMLLGKSPDIRPGSQFALTVDIYNQSREDWIGDGSHPVYLSYHWRRSDSEVSEFDGFRTPVPNRIIKSGSKVRAEMMVEAPNVEGCFVLELTLVQEQVCWFEQMGFQPFRLEVEVKR